MQNVLKEWWCFVFQKNCYTLTSDLYSSPHLWLLNQTQTWQISSEVQTLPTTISGLPISENSSSNISKLLIFMGFFKLKVNFGIRGTNWRPKLEEIISGTGSALWKKRNGTVQNSLLSQLLENLKCSVPLKLSQTNFQCWKIKNLPKFF